MNFTDMNYIRSEFYKSDITAGVIGCAYRVHNYLGNDFQEVIYQRALQYEFAYKRIKFEREKEMPIWYREVKLGERRVDFLVDDDIMVELKAITMLEDVHIAQLINYIEAYKVRVGLLLNFGARKLEVRRFIK